MSRTCRRSVSIASEIGPFFGVSKRSIPIPSSQGSSTTPARARALQEVTTSPARRAGRQAASHIERPAPGTAGRADSDSSPGGQGNGSSAAPDSHLETACAPAVPSRRSSLWSARASSEPTLMPPPRVLGPVLDPRRDRRKPPRGQLGPVSRVHRCWSRPRERDRGVVLARAELAEFAPEHDDLTLDPLFRREHLAQAADDALGGGIEDREARERRAKHSRKSRDPGRYGFRRSVESGRPARSPGPDRLGWSDRSGRREPRYRDASWLCSFDQREHASDRLHAVAHRVGTEPRRRRQRRSDSTRSVVAGDQARKMPPRVRPSSVQRAREPRDPIEINPASRRIASSISRPVVLPGRRRAFPCLRAYRNRRFTTGCGSARFVRPRGSTRRSRRRVARQPPGQCSRNRRDGAKSIPSRNSSPSPPRATSTCASGGLRALETIVSAVSNAWCAKEQLGGRGEDRDGVAFGRQSQGPSGMPEDGVKRPPHGVGEYAVDRYERRDAGACRIRSVDRPLEPAG